MTQRPPTLDLREKNGMPEKIDQWLLFRGLGRHAGHWLEFPQKLHQQLGPAEILSPDLPGTGLRYQEKSPRTIHALVDSVRARVPPAKGKRYLIGISLGGMVALDWLAFHPNEIAGAVIINSSARGLSSASERLLPSARRMLLQAALKDMRGREIAALEATTARPPTGAALEHWITVSEKSPMSARNGARQLVAAALFYLPKKSSVPVLFLTSEGDKLASPSCSRKMAQAWNAPVKVHPWAGHDLSLDDPDWIVNEILAWLKSSR